MKFYKVSVLGLTLTLLASCSASFRSVSEGKSKAGEGDATPILPEGGDVEPGSVPMGGTPDGSDDLNGEKDPSGTPNQNQTPDQNGDGKGWPSDQGQGPEQNSGQNDPKVINLDVTTPSPEIRAGGEKMPATAKIRDGAVNPPVTWSVTGPLGRPDIGSIDSNGVYTSPVKTDSEFPVTLIATLIADPSVKGSTTLKILPTERIFARCTQNNMIFPILAHVYQINGTATQLPNFENPAEARKVTTVCMDKYAVAPRNFDSGFPDVPGLFEFFALQTTSTLVVPADGTYVIQLNSDDGAELYLDGTLVIDNDGLHQANGTDPSDSPNTGHKEVSLQLLKGEHALNLNYFQGPRYRIALELKWKKPGSANFEYIPREAFK